jgi:hypothetical protein
MGPAFDAGTRNNPGNRKPYVLRSRALATLQKLECCSDFSPLQIDRADPAVPVMAVVSTKTTLLD